MKAVVRLVGLEGDKPKLFNGDIGDITLMEPSIIAIDGSTTCTGVAILRECDGAISCSIAFIREDETPVQYKVRLKRAIKDILARNRHITKVYYEEPFLGYAKAAMNLMMLRTFVEELIEENEPNFNYLTNIEVSNMKWKKLFLTPEKVAAGTEAQKEQVYKKLIACLPFLDGITQDEADAISMGFVAAVKLKQGTEDELESKKKARPFQYNSRFIGADDDDGMLQEFHDIYDGPKHLLDEGTRMITIPSTANFDKKVYEAMGSEDRVVIVKFASHHHGNIILANRIGHLCASFSYIYAIIWRKTRK